MDTIPAQPIQEIPNQQAPVQPTTSFTGTPIQNFPKKRSLRKFFNITSWIILFALLPITVLIFLSQDSIPGDFFYPVKRSMENIVLAAASVSPATRAAFRTDLTETRFKEAQSLVVSKSNTSGLSTFIDEVQGTQLEVASLRNDTEREKAEEKLIGKIEEYQTGLFTLQAKTEQNIIASAANLPSVTATLTPTPTLVPTSTPTPLSSFKFQPTPTLTPVPTLILAPTSAPTLPSQPENAQVSEQKKIAQSLKETKEHLDRIRKDLEERKEERQERRSEKKDKDDRESKDKSDRNK